MREIGFAFLQWTTQLGSYPSIPQFVGVEAMNDYNLLSLSLSPNTAEEMTQNFNSVSWHEIGHHNSVHYCIHVILTIGRNNHVSFKALYNVYLVLTMKCLNLNSIHHLLFLTQTQTLTLKFLRTPIL